MKSKKLLVTAPWKIEFVDDEFSEKIENANELIIKNKYSHLSAGTESACVAGIEGWFNIPDTPGYTSIGEVLEKGENVSHIEVGDIVFTYGPHAQYFKIDTTDRWHGVCVKLPTNINQEYASFSHMAGIALTSIRQSNIELGDYVLVTGLGAIGNIAAQLAQLQGGIVIGVDINDDRIDIAKKSGIQFSVNSAKENLAQKVLEITKGARVSTYIEASGMSVVLEKTIENIAVYGEAILLGTPRKPYQTDLTKTLQQIHLWKGDQGSLSMKGALEFIYPTHAVEFVKHSIERNANILLNLIKEDKLKIAPLYSHKINPVDCQKAYEGLRDKPDEYIGVVFDWTVVK